MNKPIRSGIILAPIVETDYMFGKLGDTEIRVSDGNWTQFLPANEKQRQGFESMCCTNFSSTSAVEILFTRLIELKLMSVGNLKWLNDNGYIDVGGHINFSDRFDALVSGTSPDYGNTLKAPADAKHKYGLIPESVLPWTDSEVDYFNKTKITPQMYVLGQEFLKRFTINYEMVYASDYATALRISPLAGACFAWNGINNGVYYRVENPTNHAIAIIDPPTIWQIFDSYDPFIKKLADNYNLMGYAVRYIITESEPLPQTVKKNMYTLKRDPNDTSEVYAFSEDGLAKRHLANKGTLIQGATNLDKYWTWTETTTIPNATSLEWGKATECAEILLLAPDNKYVEVPTGGFSLWAWIKSLFK